MSYNEYMVEYQILASDAIQNNFSWVEASSPEEAGEKVISQKNSLVKVIKVVLCDDQYWRIK
jgi:hypothetical protein